MKKYFAVGDVHSFYNDWMQALKEKGFDQNNKEHYVIVCGDLFDRGDQSIECYEFMVNMMSEGRGIYVRGNHEDLLNECLEGLTKGSNVGSHHLSNGTITTITSFMGLPSIYDVLCQTYDKDKFIEVKSRIQSFIDTSVDYFELGNTVFVHGWVPTTCDEDRTMIVHSNWRDGDWKQARWENGMEMFHFGITPPDVSTVVCGHWHTSFAWSKYKHKGSEWDYDAIFDTYVDKHEGNKIIALDGCVAYTRTVNCEVFDEEGNLL